MESSKLMLIVTDKEDDITENVTETESAESVPTSTENTQEKSDDPLSNLRYGKELALVHIKMNNHGQALPLLLHLEETYVSQKWPPLLADIRSCLLECYKVLDDTKKQLQYTTLLAATKAIPESERESHWSAAKVLVDNLVAQGEQVTLKMDELFAIFDLQLHKDKSSLVPELRLRINSNFCTKMSCSRISVFLQYEPLKPERRGSSTPASAFGHHRCKHSASGGKAPIFQLFSGPIPSAKPTSSESSSGFGVKCPNINECLKRTDNHEYYVKNEPQVPETEFAFELKDAVIPAGESEWILQFSTGQQEKCGEYSIHQIVFEWEKNVFFVMREPPEHICFRVVLEDPKIKIIPNALDNGQQDILAGFPQNVTLELTCGSLEIQSGTVLKIKPSIGVKIQRTSESNFAEEIIFQLEDGLKPFEVLLLPLTILVTLSNQRQPIGNEHQISVSYTATKESKPKLLSGSFHAVPPFMSSMKLHTCNKMKFVEIIVHGLTTRKLTVKDWDLSVAQQVGEGTSVNPLADLNEMLLCKDHSLHYTWKLVHLNEDTHATKLLFSAKYGLENSDYSFHEYSCEFKVTDYRTLYLINAAVEPPKGIGFCRVGTVCFLNVVVEKTQEKENDQVMFEVTTDSTLWTINGRASGFLSDRVENKYNLEFEVLPMSSGFLPLPSIRLSKYITKIVGKPNVTEERLVALDDGQVYNKSKGTQVYVLPSSGQ